jgi:uncharacterized membrane protein
MQARMRELAAAAVAEDKPRMFRWWFAFGFPAFGAAAVIFWLMIARPPEIW